MFLKRPVWLAAAMLSALTITLSATAGETINATTPQEAIDKVKMQADQQGDPAAMIQMAQWYEQGANANGVPLVPRNHTEALKYYTMASQGNIFPEALLATGLCYEFGLGTAVDLTKAGQYYSEAVKLKFPPAQFKVAELLIQGYIFPRDIANGLSYLKEAFNNGNADAGFQLALINLQGRFEQKVDLPAGVKWLRDAAELGNVPAIQALAELCRVGLVENAAGGAATGQVIMERDLGEAMMWYLVLAKVNALPQQAVQQVNALRNGMTQDEIRKADDEAVTWLRGLEIRQKATADTQRKITDERVAKYKATYGSK